MQTKLTLLQEDSHASRFQKLGTNQEKNMTVISGEKCLEQSEKLDRVGLLAKMLLISNEWASKKCSLNWKMKVIQQKFIIYQLSASVHRIKGKDSGLLPTITNSDYRKCNKEEFKKYLTLKKTSAYRLRSYLAWKENKDGYINPLFAELLMGYPPNWTNVE